MPAKSKMSRFIRMLARRCSHERGGRASLDRTAEAAVLHGRCRLTTALNELSIIAEGNISSIVSSFRN